VWGDPSTPAGLLRHVARGDYGTASLSASHGAPKALAHLAALGRHLVVDPLVAPAALALVAVVARLLRPGVAGRASLLALVASIALAGPMFASRFNAPLVAVGPLIVERFYLLPSLLVAVLAALDALLRAGRPVYVTNASVPGVARAFPCYAMARAGAIARRWLPAE
jgi:hypothetical protein